MDKDTTPETAAGKTETSALIIDYFHRTMMHHAMWFAEVQQHLGREKAMEIMEKAYTLSYDIQMKR
ncbi:MAG: cytosolic protein, partial [Bacteroidota bacterium]